MDPVKTGHVYSIRRIAARDNSGGELNGPCEMLFHLIEAAVAIDHRSVALQLGRLFAGKIPARIQRIDTDVHQGTASAEFPAQPPLSCLNIEAVRALDGLH